MDCFSIARVKLITSLERKDEVYSDAATHIDGSIPIACALTGIVIPVSDVEDIGRGVRARVRLGWASRYASVGRGG